jgi:hypothetical protein
LTPSRRRRRGRGSGAPAALLAALLTPAAGAVETTTSWSFEVQAVEDLGPDEHVVRLAPVPRGPRFPRSCEALVVHVKRDPDRLEPKKRALARPEGEALALRGLRAAVGSGRLLRFGRIEDGFGPIEGRPECEVESRALLVLREGDGVVAVYSLYQ